jgi:hypothetical protein
MLTSSLLRLILSLLVVVMVVSTDMCCVTCDESEGLIKYYSIDTRMNNCGECCMRPEDYDLYKKFEKGLTLSNSSTICADLNYTTYIDTVTHGFLDIKMTLDLYGPADSKKKKK